MGEFLGEFWSQGREEEQSWGLTLGQIWGRLRQWSVHGAEEKGFLRRVCGKEGDSANERLTDSG